MCENYQKKRKQNKAKKYAALITATKKHQALFTSTIAFQQKNKIK